MKQFSFVVLWLLDKDLSCIWVVGKDVLQESIIHVLPQSALCVYLFCKCTRVCRQGTAKIVGTTSNKLLDKVIKIAGWQKVGAEVPQPPYRRSAWFVPHLHFQNLATLCPVCTNRELHSTKCVQELLRNFYNYNLIKRSPKLRNVKN